MNNKNPKINKLKDYIIGKTIVIEKFSVRLYKSKFLINFILILLIWLLINILNNINNHRYFSLLKIDLNLGGDISITNHEGRLRYR